MTYTSDELSSYCIGLVIYTYEDLIKRGKTLSVLIRRVQQTFPELDLNQFIALPTEGGRFEELDAKEFHLGLENGSFARLQITSAPSDENLPSGLIRASVNNAITSPGTPNYFFFSFPAIYYQTNIDSVQTRLLSIGREAFDFLNGVFGFAHLGFLSLQDNTSPSLLNPPLAIPPFDFRDLYIPSDLHQEIPYIFWANWLGRTHVDRLGGIDNIQSAIQQVRVDRMSRGALLITAYPTALSTKEEIDDDSLGSIASYLVSAHKEFFDNPKAKNKNISPIENSAGMDIGDTTVEGEKAQLSLALNRMTWHVKKFEKDYLDNNKAPRNYVWRPYRFCTQDVVLGLTVVRHSVDNNCLDVDVCLTTDLPEFEEGSSARVMWSFLLSEAFKCGGTMEIRFSEYVEGGHIPRNLAFFAQKLGIEFGHDDEGRITPTEARRVYLAITQFTPQLREKIFSMAEEDLLSPERACYAVHRGLWTQPELTQIVLSSPNAERILSGDIPPEHRLLFSNATDHARSAILGGFLDRKLLKRVRIDTKEVVEREDDVLPLQIDFDPTYSAKIYFCPEGFPIPWIANGYTNVPPVAKFCPLVVLIRARDRDELALSLETDLKLAENISLRMVKGNKIGRVAILIPRDFEDLPSNQQSKLVEKAEKQITPILICPETIAGLDAEVARRFTSSRITRE